MISKFTGDNFTPSAYDVIIVLKYIPLLEQEGESKAWRDLSKIVVATVGTPVSALTMISLDNVRDALELLTGSRHCAWPVIESHDSTRLLGLLARNHLLDCLEHNETLLGDIAGRDISAAEEAAVLDTGPFVHRYPVVMLQNAPVSQA